MPQKLRNILERRKGERNQVRRELESARQNLKDTKRNVLRNEKALAVIRTVGLETQQQLQFHISEITSLALETVFDDPYELKALFVERRNKTECDLMFERNGELISPLEASGGGTVDIAAFALRVASWSMQRPQSDNVLILDEPYSRLKGEEANRRALQLLHTISSRMGLQIIMVADERIPREDLLEFADRAFEVSIENGVSHVKQLNKGENNVER